MEITTFSADLAKNKFQVHGFDARGEKRLCRTLKRAQVLSFFEAQDVLLAHATREPWIKARTALVNQLIDERIAACDRVLQAQYRDTPACQRIGAVGGIGVMTATATLALVGDARHMRSGRHLSAWLVLTPREHLKQQGPSVRPASAHSE